MPYTSDNEYLLRIVNNGYGLELCTDLDTSLGGESLIAARSNFKAKQQLHKDLFIRALRGLIYGR